MTTHVLRNPSLEPNLVHRLLTISHSYIKPIKPISNPHAALAAPLMDAKYPEAFQRLATTHALELRISNLDHAVPRLCKINAAANRKSSRPVSTKAATIG